MCASGGLLWVNVAAVGGTSSEVEGEVEESLLLHCYSKQERAFLKTKSYKCLVQRSRECKRKSTGGGL